MALLANKVYRGDCVQRLNEIKPGSVDLVFADPPFNIGYEYDVYRDVRSREEYLEWCHQWMSAVATALKSTGTFWLAIGDEFAAELKLIAQDKVGFSCRSWVIWYYTFGVNCVQGFSRSHTHLFHFVKDPGSFTFNSENPAVRVLSARQLVYADGRANSKGRLPDNTWILRPQDAPPSGFSPIHDTWYFARVAGTFGERKGFHGCQMPEQLLGRIVRVSSNPLDLVVDPFAGSGTTLVAANKLGRRWLGIELSADYVKQIKSRLAGCRPGDPLDGPADGLRSAPKTSRGKRKVRLRNGRSVPQLDPDTEKGLVAAYVSTCKGFSADHLLCDPELNERFVRACQKTSLRGDAYLWNRLLLRIRKAGRLKVTERTAGRRLTSAGMDAYSAASEVAMQLLSLDYGLTLDEFLCSPVMAAEFDRLAEAFSGGYSPFEYRWAAITIRKRARKSKSLAQDHFVDWKNDDLPRAMSLARCATEKYERPGVYVLSNHAQTLYVGETLNVRARVEQVLSTPGWMDLEPQSVRFIPSDGHSLQLGLQSRVIQQTDPLLNSHMLRPPCEAAV